MDQYPEAEAFEVLPPFTSEYESEDESDLEAGPGYETGPAFEYEDPQGEFESEDEVVRDHRGGGSVYARRGRPTVVRRVSHAPVHRASSPAWRSSWHSAAGYHPRGGGPGYGSYGGYPRYGSGSYGVGYGGARPWSGGRWGQWPQWGRGRWPMQAWGWDGGAAGSPDGDDDPGYPPPPVPIIIQAPPAMAPMSAPDPIPPVAPMAGAGPTADPSAPQAAGGASEFGEYGEYGEYGEFGGLGGGRGQGHPHGCRCGGCRRRSGFGGFGEFEDEVARRPDGPQGGGTAAAAACAPYAPGEVQRSTSAAGLLPADVIDHPRGTLVCDFGVDWRTPRDTLAGDPLLKNRLSGWIATARSDPTLRMRILGFSDCVGNERDNLFLRKGRATRLVALLERMAGSSAFAALRPRITTIDAAPIGDFVATNSTIEGRAQNRGVLVEFTRTMSFDQGDTIEACRPKPANVARYPLVALLPNVAGYRGPLPIDYRLDAKKMVGELAQDISSLGEKAHVVVEALDWGLHGAEIFALIGETGALAGAVAVLSPLLAAAGVFLGLGAGYAEAAEKIAREWSASGFSRGVVMAADGRSFSRMRDLFNLSPRAFPKNGFLPQGPAIALANYRAGLVAGYAQARALCPAQRAILMRDLGRRIGDESWRGPQSRWTADGWKDWYIKLAATFAAAHLAR